MDEVLAFLQSNRVDAVISFVLGMAALLLAILLAPSLVLIGFIVVCCTCGTIISALLLTIIGFKLKELYHA